MCSSPHWQVGLSWFREKLSPANREQRLSRWADFAKNCLPRIGSKELPRFREKYRALGRQKMGSNMRPRYIQFRDIRDRDISGLHCTSPFLNFNGATIEVWKWISDFISHFTGHVIIYPCWDLFELIEICHQRSYPFVCWIILKKELNWISYPFSKFRWCILLYPPHNEVVGGYIGITPSVHPSVRLSVSQSVCSTVLPLVLGVVTRQKPQINGSVVLGDDESPWPCSTPSWYTPLSWMILSKQKNIHLFLSQYDCPSVRQPIPHPVSAPYSSGWIHSIFIQLITQLQKVCQIQSFFCNI